MLFYICIYDRGRRTESNATVTRADMQYGTRVGEFETLSMKHDNLSIDVNRDHVTREFVMRVMNGECVSFSYDYAMSLVDATFSNIKYIPNHKNTLLSSGTGPGEIRLS